MSPFLWNCVLNSLLVDLRNRGFHVHAYADDVAVMVTGTNMLWIKGRTQKALNIASNWAYSQELQFSSKKTEIVLFTNKRKPVFGTLRLNGRQLEISKATLHMYNPRSGVGNLQGIAGHIARMIFSAGHIYVSCAKITKSSFENLVGSKKNGHHVCRSPIFRPKSSEEQKKGHHVRRPKFELCNCALTCFHCSICRNVKKEDILW